MFPPPPAVHIVSTPDQSAETASANDCVPGRNWWPICLLLGSQEAGPDRGGDGRSSVTGAETLEDDSQMLLYRFGTAAEPLRDGVVAMSLSNESKDFILPHGDPFHGWDAGREILG